MIPLSAHLSMLFTEHAEVDRPAAAAGAGFTHVESWWPPAPDLDAWVDAIRSTGLRVSCLNADGGDIAAGDRGFCNLPERDDDTHAAVSAALALAARVGADRINVLPGLRAPDRGMDDQLSHAASVYRRLGELAAEQGAVIVVEPINAIDVPRYLTPTPDDVATLLARVDHPNVRMLLDAYHVAKGGGDPVADVRRHADLIGHVQYADHPGRGAPGTGDVALEPFLAALEEVGYTGAVGLEFDPNGPTLPAVAGLPR